MRQKLSIDKTMRKINREWRRCWCVKKDCVCSGCVNKSVNYQEMGELPIEKDEWEWWVEHNKLLTIHANRDKYFSRDEENDCAEIIMVTDGSITIECDDFELTVSAKDFINTLKNYMGNDD